MLLKCDDDRSQVRNFFLRIRLLLHADLWQRFLDLDLLLFSGSLCILLLLEKLRIKPSPFQTLKRVVIFFGEIQKLSLRDCCQLQCRLVHLIDKIFVIFSIFETPEILDLLIKLLILNKVRYFGENLLKVFREHKGVKFTHCFFYFFSLDIKLLDIIVYILSWVFDR